MPDEDVGRMETLTAEPNGGPPGEELEQEQIEEQDDPWTALGEEAADLRQKKGWKDPAELVKAYRELESQRGREGDELGRLQQRLQEYEEYLGQLEEERQGQQAPATPEQGFDWDTVGQALEQNPGGTMAWYTANVIGPMVEKLLEERLGELRKSEIEPIGQMMGSLHWEREAQRLRGVYGDDFAELSDQVIAELRRDQSLAQRADGMELAYAKIHGAKQARAAAERRRAAGATTLDSSSRAQRTAESQAEAIRRAIREAGGVRRADDPL
jgi:hypothetical protein